MSLEQDPPRGPSPEAPAAHPATLPHAAPAVTSQALFRGGRELVIQHGSEAYRLRITRQDKLILTK